MHFCVSATRGGSHDGFCWPRKIGTNWFMPAFVKSRFGESGRSEADGTMVCCFSRKKSRNDWRICAEVMRDEIQGGNADFQIEILLRTRDGFSVNLSAKCWSSRARPFSRRRG